MKWFKFYGQDWLTDLKVMKMTPEDRLCFITLLCLASSADEGGVIRDCDEDAIIKLTNLPDDPTHDFNPAERAVGCLKRYEALQIVTLGDNGLVTVRAFGRRQDENLSNAERQRKYRERLRIRPKERNASYVTPSNDSNARLDKNRLDKNRINPLPLFDQFWETYPTKVKKDKAREAWLKIPAQERPLILPAITTQLANAHFRGKDGIDYIPHPTTWLNQRRWEDQVEIKKSDVKNYG